MKFVVEKIEENIVVLESLDDTQKKEVLLSELPKDIKEGNVLSFQNETYIKDEELEQQRRISIKNKFDMLKKRKVDNF